MIERLGAGAFGAVYRARDEELGRDVAVKVPHQHIIKGEAEIETFMSEARVLARMDFPAIVPVYDVNRLDDGRCYLVSKFISGSSLADHMRGRRIEFIQGVRWTAELAEALHHAHERGLVHRDVKPANLLIDNDRNPHLTDFGLAVYAGGGAGELGPVGTPLYMSPEQANGEGHRVDARSDVYSLGAVFYELLTGRRPFLSTDLPVLLKQIALEEPRPPRQIDDAIPRELDRICLKAIAKRAGDRYGTASEMAEDLWAWVEQQGGAASQRTAYLHNAQDGIAVVAAPPMTRAMDAPASRMSRPHSYGSAGPPLSTGSSGSAAGTAAAARIVPKGLRSFDTEDADFFLRLLPGPRGRDGLPESIRFWKARIEATDAESAFRVGLLYGPSGCGKSSLVKAGLLPRLAPHVTTVYVEAAGDSTEVRVMNALRRRFPSLGGSRNLVDALGDLRRGRGLAPQNKLILVIDQFEQWLHEHRDDENPQMVEALRQCDGCRVQAMILVRDDFWMAITRFMRELEVPLVEGQNSAAVDLFNARHARYVLHGFGQALNCLPADPEAPSAPQEAFLAQAVSELSEDGKLIPVRLALFADMMKKRPWTPQTLKALGGAAGIGVAFFEETFNSPSAPPEHRLHQRAARQVLRSLLFLPGQSSDIKGRIRSREELLEASGYQRRPADFEELMRILDNDLRVVTPTDPQGGNEEPAAAAADGGQRQRGRFYQLTHDYLVHALREWLTLKQRETRHGRAQLRLAELTSHWVARPQPAHLPSGADWAWIRLMTRKREWSPDERRVMLAATRRHLLRGGVAAALLVVAMLVIVDVRGRVRARTLCDQVAFVDPDKLPSIVKQMAGLRRWTDPLLRETFDKAASGSREKLNAGLALVVSDPLPLDYLLGRAYSAGTNEFAVLRDALVTQADRAAPQLWTTLEDASAPDARRLRAALLLASYPPAAPAKGQETRERWQRSSKFLISQLIAIAVNDTGRYDELFKGLAPIGRELTVAAQRFYREPARPQAQRAIAMDLAQAYAGDDLAVLSDVLVNSGDFARYPRLVDRLATRATESKAILIAILESDPAQRVQRARTQAMAENAQVTIDPGLAQQFRSAQGALEATYAFSQTMPLGAFTQVVEAMRKAGYRPLQVRPFDANGSVQVASSWIRDSAEWRYADGLTEQEAAQRNDAWVAEGFHANSVAGYLEKGRFLFALAATKDPAVTKSRLLFGVDEAAAWKDFSENRSTGVPPLSHHVALGENGEIRFSRVAYEDKTHTGSMHGLSPRVLLPDQSDLPWYDLCLCDDRQTPQRYARQIQARKNASQPAQLSSRMQAEEALGLDEQVIATATKLLAAQANDGNALGTRARAYARLGRAEEARADVAALDAAAGDLVRVRLAAIVELWLGGGGAPALRPIDEVVLKKPKDGETLVNAASVYAEASAVAARQKKPEAQAYAEHAVSLIEQAPDLGLIGFQPSSAVWDPLRLIDRFARLEERLQSGVGYVFVRRGLDGYETKLLRGMDVTAHTLACRDLAAKGFEPWSISLAAIGSDRVAAASIWRRPLDRQALTTVARQNANAAALLLRLGEPQRVWPLLRNQPDPSQRSALVHALSAAGTNVDLLLQRLNDETDESARRALIQIIGESGAQITGGAKAQTGETLLEIYRNHPDAGMHASAKWALRKLGMSEALEAAERLAVPSANADARNWRVTAGGQTMIRIAGPVEFQMGSDAYEEGKSYNEARHLRRIPRSFEIAATSITVGQFRQFLQDEPDQKSAFKHLEGLDPQLPVNKVTWFDAARYCRWLSQKEQIPESQIVYEHPAEGGRDAMTIRTGSLLRTGYRLPTEAEWEYAVRAGSQTTYFFGTDKSLTSDYVWIQQIPVQLRSAGLLKPNDLGLFDATGNGSNWCHNPYDLAVEKVDLDSSAELAVAAGSNFSLRGTLRSAFRGEGQPFTRADIRGFRIARTLPAFAAAADRTRPTESNVIICGPTAPFVVRVMRGDVTVTPTSGTVPAQLIVKAPTPAGAPYALQIERRDNGERIEVAGEVAPSMEWTVQFYALEDGKAPQTKGNWKAVLLNAPLATITTPRLHLNWGNAAPASGVNASRFATVATARAQLPPGQYELTTVSDDGIRVYMNDKLVLNNFTDHQSAEDKAIFSVTDPVQNFRVEHFNSNGPAILSLDLRRIDGK